MRRADRQRARATVVFGGRRGSPRCSRCGGDRGVRPPRPDRRAAPRRSSAATRRPGGADLRSRLTTVGNNGRLGDLARRARRGRRSNPLARRRGRARTGSRGSASRPAPPAQRRRRALALLRDAGRARLDRHRAAADRLRGPARRWPSRACGGPGATATPPSSPPATALLLHAMVDWDWEMPALFIWFFGAAGAVLAAPAEAAENARASRGG